ncbi:MAG TPA: hypothetical protein DCY03_02990 [Planctomycetaceae bacterium]|nr:hypothetical protein [Planctomycetaceae bacterium]
MGAHVWFPKNKVRLGTLATYASADGLRWKTLHAAKPVQAELQVEEMLLPPLHFEPVGGLYKWDGLYYVNGQNAIAASRPYHGRVVRQFISPDFETWSHASTVGFVRPQQYHLLGPGRSREGEQNHEGVSVWNRGNVLLGISGIWHGAREWKDVTIDLGFVVSNDGVQFRQPAYEWTFLKRGADGEWDQGTVVAITHDRYFLDNVAGWILELERGRGIPFEGNYSSWLEQKQARLAVEEKQESKRQKFLKRELEWVRMSPKAQATKNKARVQRYEELAAEDYANRDDASDIQIPISRPLGSRVLVAENLTKGFGDKLLFENFNFELPRGGIVGVIGPNGAGKTTLFKMIMGQEQPDSGTLELGETVELSYVDQSRDSLNPKKTVYEEISQGHEHLVVGKSSIHARTYVGRFNFKGPDQQKLVGELSGGERNRVHMAKLLRSGGNLLLLDEPTNDLDVDTLRSLEEGLEHYTGCALVVSHDRWFLDRLATHIIAFEGDSQVRWFEGNYKMYEAKRHEELGKDADSPHRLQFKPLSR